MKFLRPTQFYMIKTLVFDLDDTLFLERDFVRSGFKAVDHWLIENCKIKSFFSIAWDLFESGKRNTIFNLTFEQLELEYDSSMIQQLLQVYREHKPSIHLYEDAKFVIKYFSRKANLCVITDGHLVAQKNKVSALGINDAFDVILYSDAYGREHWKPSLLPYLKIMEFTNSKGSECMYVGDNPHKDFVTAKKLGWKTVRIMRQEGEHKKNQVEESYKANLQIRSLYELCKLEEFM